MRPKRSHGVGTFAGILSIMGAICLACAGCSTNSNSTSQTTSGSQITIKLGMENSKTSSEYLSAERFGNVLKKLTNSKLIIKIYPSEELGSTSSEIQGVRAGNIQAIATSALDSVVKSVDVSLLPYMFTSMNQAQKVLNSQQMYNVLWDKFSAYDLHVVGTWPVGALGIMSRKSGTATLSSLHGQRIRVLAPLVVTPLLKAWGANPTPVDAQQVLTSLSTDLIDGVFDPPDPITTQGWQQYGKSYLQTNSIYNVDPVVFSQKFLNSLTPSLRTDITTAFTQSLSYADNLVNTQNSQALTQMKHDGIAVYTPNSAPFEAAAKTVQSEWESEFGKSIVDQVQAVAKKAR